MVGRLGQEGLSAPVGQPYLARCDQTYRNNIIVRERVSSFLVQSFLRYLLIIGPDDETNETGKGRDAVG